MTVVVATVIILLNPGIHCQMMAVSMMVMVYILMTTFVGLSRIESQGHWVGTHIPHHSSWNVFILMSCNRDWSSIRVNILNQGTVTIISSSCGCSRGPCRRRGQIPDNKLSIRHDRWTSCRSWSSRWIWRRSPRRRVDDVALLNHVNQLLLLHRLMIIMLMMPDMI